MKTLVPGSQKLWPIVHSDSITCCWAGGSHSHQKQNKKEEEDEGDEEDQMESNQIMQTIINTEATLNEKLEKSQLKLFSSSAAISSEVGHRCLKFEFDKLEHFKTNLLILSPTFYAFYR